MENGKICTAPSPEITPQSCICKNGTICVHMGRGGLNQASYLESVQIDPTGLSTSSYQDVYFSKVLTEGNKAL